MWKIIKKWLTEESDQLTDPSKQKEGKCYICRNKDKVENLSIVRSYIMVCGYDSKYHPDYFVHKECVRKALNLEEGYDNGAVDRAIEIADSLRERERDIERGLKSIDKWM